MLPMAVTRPSFGRVTKSQGEGAISEDFFLIDNALYSIAFETHTKTAEPIEMPFGMTRGTVCYVRVTIPEGEWAVFGENVPGKPNTPNNFELDWSMQRHATGTDA